MHDPGHTVVKAHRVAGLGHPEPPGQPPSMNTVTVSLPDRGTKRTPKPHGRQSTSCGGAMGTLNHRDNPMRGKGHRARAKDNFTQNDYNATTPIYMTGAGDDTSARST